MEPLEQPDRPFLIVVTGRPGSGKSTLAHRLARAVRCPLVSRDEFKEGLINTAGTAGPLSDDDVARHTYAAFFDAIGLLVDRRITLVAEAAYQHKLWSPRLTPLTRLARVRILVCTVDPQLARSRHVARGLADPGRERFHPDAVVRAAREGTEPPPIGDYDPPRLDVPTLTVDTTDGYRPDLDAIAAFAIGSGP